MFSIYKLTNSKNGKSYIGYTSQSVKRRVEQHNQDARKGLNGCPKLWPAIRKYGIDSFSIEILENTDNLEEIWIREQFYISEYNTLNDGYNANKGGIGSPPLSNETKSIISEKSKRSKRFSGKHHTYETRSRISESCKKNNSHKKKVFDGSQTFKSYTECAKYHGINYNSVRRRIGSKNFPVWTHG